MNSNLDTYRTITKSSSEVLFKDRNSKFFGVAIPVKTEDDVKEAILNLKKKHHSARHWCYAYQLGIENFAYRVNDDGEPNNSAGQPIYGQIQSFNLTNVLIVVVRYFGGTKLGVGGLINAYRTASKMAIEKSKIVTRTIDITYQLTFDYKHMNKVMRIIKEKRLRIFSQTLEIDCRINIAVRKKDATTVLNVFKVLHDIKITEID